MLVFCCVTIYNHKKVAIMGSPSPAAIKRKRLYYTADDDLYLLREVARQNPYMQPHRWDDIQKNMEELTGKKFGLRSLKERVQLIVDKFRLKFEHDQYKSGIEEEVTELDDLLHQILLLMDEVLRTKKAKSSSYQRGHEKREQAVSGITGNENQTEPSSGTNNPQEVDENEELVEEDQDMQTAGVETDLERQSGPKTPDASVGNGRGNGRRGTNRGRSGVSTSSRLKRAGIKQSSIQFLETKNERWFEIRKRELDLEERKFQFDMEERRRKLAIEEARLGLEQERFEAQLTIFNNQTKLMENQQRLIQMAFQVRPGN